MIVTLTGWAFKKLYAASARVRNHGHASPGSRINRQCAGRLNSVCKLEAERRPQSRSAFRNVGAKRDRLPRFEDRAVALRERVVTCLEGPGQHLGDGDDRYGE